MADVTLYARMEAELIAAQARAEAAEGQVAALVEHAKRIAQSYGYPPTSQLARALEEMIESGAELARQHDAALVERATVEQCAKVVRELRGRWDGAIGIGALIQAEQAILSLHRAPEEAGGA